MIIGGGIAGLATAYELGQLGVHDVLVLEAESMLATQASARNAAIFLPLEESINAVWLAARSRALIDARLGTSWLSAQGIALVSGYTEPLDELRYAARKYGVFHERWSALQIEGRLPMLAGSDVHHALFLPLGGIMDVHALLTALTRWARAAGTRIETGARVAGIVVREGRVRSVELSDGRSVASERVVLAAGAWNGQLGKLAGAELALKALRRHLVLLRGGEKHSWKSPVVWRVDDAPAYFRPEAGCTLASPCDETAVEPGVPSVDPEQLTHLSQKLETLAPALADAEVRRIWACLRTVTEDRELCAGPDPRVEGLFWLAGLGGRGMSCGIAAGELVARSIVGLPHPLSRNLSPARLI